MKRLAKARHQCRRCPLRAPSGRCLNPVLRSGRCGDWIWYLRGGKQCRRPYVCPKDPRTPAQLGRRARFKAASRKYSRSLTQEQRDACIAAGAKVRSRERLGQSGALTGQQYSVQGELVPQQVKEKAQKAVIAPKVSQPQRVTKSTSGIHRSPSRVALESRRPGAVDVRKGRVGIGLVARRRAAGLARRAIAPPGHVWHTLRVTRNTVARRRRQSKAPGAVEV